MYEAKYKPVFGQEADNVHPWGFIIVQAHSLTSKEKQNIYFEEKLGNASACFLSCLSPGMYFHYLLFNSVESRILVRGL